MNAAESRIKFRDFLRLLRGVVMGLRDVVAKKILTELIIKGALGCTTLTL